MKVRVMLPQAKELPELEVRPGQMLSRAFRRSLALSTPSFWTSGLQDFEEIVSVVLSHPGCGSLLGSPRNRIWDTRVTGTQLILKPLEKSFPTTPHPVHQEVKNKPQ